MVTSIQTINLGNFSLSDSTNPFSNISFNFGSSLSRIGTNLTQSQEVSGNANGTSTMEISDMILYQKDLEKLKYSPGKPYLDITMDYLYRKFLTGKERTESGFDQFFINKY